MGKSEIGARIRDVRKSKGISQQKIAEESGVSRWSITRFEQGKQTISVDNLLKICNALDAEIIINPV